MPSESPEPKTRYIVKSVVHASAILGSFRSPGEVLRLRDIVARSGLSKGMCFRLLYTMHDCGLLEKVGENEYRISFPLSGQHRFRIGYAGQDRSSSFCQQLLDGLVRACQKAQFELIVAANHHNLKAAVRNADGLIRDHVDLAVMYEGSAPEVAAKFQNAGIPLLAIDIPYPGATYFGADNHFAGLMGGRCLGQYAAQQWKGSVDDILLLEIVRSGPVVRTRVEGIMDGIKDFFPAAAKCRVVRLDTQGEFGPALECVRKYLRDSPPRRVLVGRCQRFERSRRAASLSGVWSQCVLHRGGRGWRTGSACGDARERDPLNWLGGLLSGKVWRHHRAHCHGCPVGKEHNSRCLHDPSISHS